jgi:hypothetical protein
MVGYGGWVGFMSGVLSFLEGMTGKMKPEALASPVSLNITSM